MRPAPFLPRDLTETFRFPVSISTRYVMMASMDVTPEAEALFNEVYDTEHVPNLLQVPGVRSVTRMKGQPARFAIAGSVRELPTPSPVYTAIYEIDDPQVLESPNGRKPSNAGGGRAKCARTLLTGSICFSRSSKPRGCRRGNS